MFELLKLENVGLSYDYYTYVWFYELILLLSIIK